MLPPDEQGAGRDVAKQLKVLMPTCFHKLRISDELAGHLDAGNGGANTPQPTALVINSFGKVWHVEVGRDGGGVFLGRGWLEFVASNGFGIRRFLVLWHEGRGVLTIKVFDLTCCLRESGGLQPFTATRVNRYGSHKPQFIKVLLPNFMEKMSLTTTFCNSIRFVEDCTITLKTSMKSTNCWQVDVRRYKTYGYLGGERWRSFCMENKIREGDVCTFHIVEDTLWHVVISYHALLG